MSFPTIDLHFETTSFQFSLLSTVFGVFSIHICLYDSGMGNCVSHHHLLSTNGNAVRAVFLTDSRQILFRFCKWKRIVQCEKEGKNGQRELCMNEMSLVPKPWIIFETIFIYNAWTSNRQSSPFIQSNSDSDTRDTSLSISRFQSQSHSQILSRVKIILQKKKSLTHSICFWYNSQVLST